MKNPNVSMHNRFTVFWKDTEIQYVKHLICEVQYRLADGTHKTMLSPKNPGTWCKKTLDLSGKNHRTICWGEQVTLTKKIMTQADESSISAWEITERFWCQRWQIYERQIPLWCQWIFQPLPRRPILQGRPTKARRASYFFSFCRKSSHLVWSTIPHQQAPIQYNYIEEQGYHTATRNFNFQRPKGSLRRSNN